MCLYPKLVKNPRYKPNKKNGGVIPEMIDERAQFVPIGCGMCIECMKQKANTWKIRLAEEIRTDSTGIFVTLTFSDESLKKIAEDIDTRVEGYELDNAIAKRAVRLFLERWRKRTGKSVKHWLVTEIGGNNTERIHLHGIIFTKERKEIEKTWGYGYVYLGQWVNEATINYIGKYVTKQDPKHKYYKPVILCSPGIGAGYTERPDFKKAQAELTETYRNRKGGKQALPIYYRNKLWTEEEREGLWMQRLDKGERWIMGEKVRADDDESINKLLKFYQQRNKEMGFGDPGNWEAKQYEQQRRALKQKVLNINIKDL